MIGHETVGAGDRRVVVLNDWLCDTSTWDGARAYLDERTFTWAFADLRGYGRSKEMSGAFTVEEAAADVVELADALDWPRFSVVGHSMSSLVALHLAQHVPDRIERAVVLTPPPPAGFGADGATLDAMRAIALGDDEYRLRALAATWGGRLSEGWLRVKVERWRATADPAAAAAYVTMFGRDGLPDPSARVAAPLLAVTGERDMEVMRAGAVRDLISPICEALAVVPLADCGHYPMQEAPPLLVTVVERFLGGASA